MYGLQLKGNAKKSNINKTQIFQNTIIHKNTNTFPHIYLKS